jgi:NADPH:quinone reductase-like Zn-dependent oxidoreductase
MSTTTFSRVSFTAPGPNFEHEIAQIPKPTPGDGQVLIKNKASAINPADFKRISYNIMVDQWPTSGGFESSGVVDEVGAGVDHVKQGDDVMAVGGMAGIPSFTFQEYTLVPAAFAALKPKSLSHEEAASLPWVLSLLSRNLTWLIMSVRIGAITAVASLYFGLGVPFDFLPAPNTPISGVKTVLVLGGASSVGAAAVQLLHIVGGYNVLATSSPKHFDNIKKLGASHVFDYNSASVVDEIRKIAPDGINAIFDAVNSVPLNKALLALFDGAETKILASLTTGVDVKAEDVPEGVQHTVTTMANLFKLPDGIAKTMEALSKLVEDGKYKVPIEVRKLDGGLESVGDGLKTMMKGVSGQKLVVSL